MLPLRILTYGYLPPDDALRHAAKAVSGKSWSEILILRPEITMDHNPGWNWILTTLYSAAGWDIVTLVMFSVFMMFLIFAWAALFSFRRPEAWLGSLAVMMLLFPYFADRAFVGRPLFVTMAVSLALLNLWARPEMTKPSLRTMILSVALISLSVWIHGSWYLLALLPMAFFLAQAWRKGLWLLAGWAAGTLLGALPTGDPFGFLRQAVVIPLLALGGNPPVNSLVGEFQPFHGGYLAVALVTAVLAWRKWTHRSVASVGRDPVFWLAVVGLVLGWRVLRFWLDWGLPALTLWLARQLQELSEERLPSPSWGRVGMGGAAALALWLGVASDRSARWSQYAAVEALNAANPEHAEWVPEPGGILYNVDLAIFYETFYQNPRANWRYILGFEPSFMRPQDLAVYRELWGTLNARKSCAPWIRQMTTADRLVLRGGPQPAPPIPGLEWRYVVQNTWVGRVPRTRVGTAPLQLPPPHETPGLLSAP